MPEKLIGNCIFKVSRVKDQYLLPYKTIEVQALVRPNEIAVICEQTELTYSELNRQANKLAHGLLAIKINQGSAVVVQVNPSPNILVAILAIHKIGCIYIPVDPHFPVARISAILNEVNPSVILCDEHTDGIPLKYSSICHRICEIESVAHAESNPDITVALEDISHIYFTSGTTGKPKGVLATHQNLLHYISSAINRYGFKQSDLFLAAARFTFSISMFELMVPLVAGGRVRVLPREVVLDLSRLSRAVTSATAFHFGPSLLKQLLPYIEGNYRSYEAFDQLVHVSSGGDMVPPEILEKLKKIFRNAEVYVIYGSSEINCMGCTYEVPRNVTISKTLVGSPFQDVTVKICDPEGNTVPAGVPGQIHFGGKGLAKGYLNLPELTQEKFTLMDGERLYAIGDIGRFDQEGNIELLGREDFQVQIRGMRVELLEIEACLKSYPAISDCVVMGRSLKEKAEKSLVAYLVPHPGKTIVASDLREFTVNQLPDYMIPAVFVRLDRLPTNHNAKLDRSQLPLPNDENIIVSAEFQTATNDVEKALIKIWKNLFNIENIGIDHNFFELGGDSLLAVNFLIEVDNKFDKFIPISLMLEAPTIRDIAKIVLSEKLIEGIADIAILKKGNSEPPLFCLDGLLTYKDFASSLNTKRMVCGVYLEYEEPVMHKSAESEEYRVFSSVRNIVTRFYNSIRAFQPKGPYYLCGHSFGGSIALEVARKLQEEGETIQFLAMFDGFAPGFKENSSRIKRIAYHFRKLKQFGWSYLKHKVAENTIRMAIRSNIGTDLVRGVGGLRSELRDRAFKNYLPKVYQGKVILFRARERPEFESGLEDLGWGRFIQNLVVHEVGGDHYGMIKADYVEGLANILLEEME